MNSDFRELLSALAAKNARFMVVGGYALMEYVEPRYTKDLDLVIASDPSNAEAVFAALAAFGAPLSGLQPSDFAKPDHFYQMGIPPVRVDILTSIPGVDFEDAWARRRTMQIDGEQVPVIAPEDLLAAKLASGRPQDLVDAEMLRQSLASGSSANGE